MKKILVISRYFPPAVGGTPTVIEKLFRFINSKDYIVLHARPGVMKKKIEKEKLKYEGIIIDLPEFLRKRKVPPIYLFLIPFIFFKLFKIKKRYSIQKCLIIYPDPFFSITAYIFCRVLKIPYVLYFHDIFEEVQTKPVRMVQRILAKIFEGRMIKNADPLMTLTPGLKKHYLQKYLKDSILIPHGVDVDRLKSFHFYKRQKDKYSPINILYSGSIYENQYDAIESFISALRKSDLNYKLIITSSQPQKYFNSIGLEGKDVEIKFFHNRNQLYEFQKQMDILYLPLALDSKIPLEIETSIPTKLFDYLLAMRPIFIHAPKNSNLYEFCKENEIGYLCCDKDEKEILTIVQKIKDNGYKINYQHQLSFMRQNDIKNISQKFQEIIFNEKSTRFK